MARSPGKVRARPLSALCRQNFGCSHFIVGRDHTGAGAYQNPNAAHEIFDQFPELLIKVVRFDEVYYSETLKRTSTAKGRPTGGMLESGRSVEPRHDRCSALGSRLLNGS